MTDIALGHNDGNEVEQKIAPTGASNEVTKSPSISSISSIGTDTSTDDLIRSLSSINLLDKAAAKERRVESTVKKIERLRRPDGEEIVKADVIDPDVTSRSAEAVPTIGGSSVSSTVVGADPTSPTSARSDSVPLAKKKAIKFTVRKVSHESIRSPTGSTSASSRSKSDTANPDQKKLDQLRRSQGKYDHYNSRINKINKEIDFLQNLLLPPQNYDVDFHTRNKITSAIGKLNLKKDEVEKKKYNMGISISRLWRFQDDSDIWVKGFDK